MKKEKERDWAFLPPKDDFVFKLLFGDERRKENLAGFLRAVLNLSEQELSTITIVNPYLLKEYEEDKYGIVDVKIKTILGDSINVEIQVESQTFFRKRIEFYNAKMLVEPLRDSEEYEQVKRAINVVITNFLLIPESSSYHHCFVRYDKNNRVQFSDTTEIHVLELKKIPNMSDGTELWDWLRFLKAENKEEFEMIAERSNAMKNVVSQLEVISQDEKNRMLYEDRLKHRRDEYARLDYKIQEGIQRGMQLSKQVFKLHLNGKSPEEIAKDCGISVSEVIEILS